MILSLGLLTLAACDNDAGSGKSNPDATSSQPVEIKLYCAGDKDHYCTATCTRDGQKATMDVESGSEILAVFRGRNAENLTALLATGAIVGNGMMCDLSEFTRR